MLTPVFRNLRARAKTSTSASECGVTEINSGGAFRKELNFAHVSGQVEFFWIEIFEKFYLKDKKEGVVLISFFFKKVRFADIITEFSLLENERFELLLF